MEDYLVFYTSRGGKRRFIETPQLSFQLGFPFASDSISRNIVINPDLQHETPKHVVYQGIQLAFPDPEIFPPNNEFVFTVEHLEQPQERPNRTNHDTNYLLLNHATKIALREHPDDITMTEFMGSLDAAINSILNQVPEGMTITQYLEQLDVAEESLHRTVRIEYKLALKTPLAKVRSSEMQQRISVDSDEDLFEYEKYPVRVRPTKRDVGQNKVSGPFSVKDLPVVKVEPIKKYVNALGRMILNGESPDSIVSRTIFIRPSSLFTARQHHEVGSYLRYVISREMKRYQDDRNHIEYLMAVTTRLQEHFPSVSNPSPELAKSAVFRKKSTPDSELTNHKKHWTGNDYVYKPPARPYHPPISRSIDNRHRHRVAYGPHKNRSLVTVITDPIFGSRIYRR